MLYNLKKKKKKFPFPLDNAICEQILNGYHLKISKQIFFKNSFGHYLTEKQVKYE